MERLESACPGVHLEILFVDDSSDDTAAVINTRALESARVVKVIHRDEDQRVGGLGGAVKAGLEAAESDWACVMDADLQHPPELISEMLDEARQSGADIVVASRYRAGGGVGDFSAPRRALSRASALVARALYPRRLRGVSDPMSGFFLVRRGAIDVGTLRPRGFKVLLEILVCCRVLVRTEVAFRFGERHAGDSKASIREGARYLGRLIELRVGSKAVRLVGFAAVGAVGVAVNTVMLGLLANRLHVFYILASVLATQVAILSNFALAEWVVFQGAHPVRSLRFRLSSYVLFNNCSLALTGPILVFLVSVVGMGLLAANVLSLLVLVGVRFAVADAYVWGSASLRPARRPVPSSPSPAIPPGLMLEQVEP
jgi:dolichol-phosphate mannosyltransferase